MRFKKTLIALMASSLLVGAAVAKPGMGHRGGADHWGRALQSLELTEEQQTQIDALLAQAREQKQQQRDAMRAQQETFMSNPEFDPQTAQQLQTQRQQQREANQLAQMELQHQVYQILTPEQRTELQEMKEQRRQNKGQRKGRFQRGQN